MYKWRIMFIINVRIFDYGFYMKYEREKYNKWFSIKRCFDVYGLISGRKK